MLGGMEFACSSNLATSALDGGRRPISLPCFFIPGEKTLFPTEEEVGWTLLSVWTFRETNTSYPCWKFNVCSVFQPVTEELY